MTLHDALLGLPGRALVPPLTEADQMRHDVRLPRGDDAVVTTEPIQTTRARDEHDGKPCAVCRARIVKGQIVHMDQAGHLWHAFNGCPR